MRSMLAILAAAAAGIWLAWPHAAERPHALPTAALPAPLAPPAPAHSRLFFDATASENVDQQPADAAASMARTRLHGDPDAPPIARGPDPQRASPSHEVLSNVQAYQNWEQHQKQRVYAAYIKAVDQELPRLQDDIARARAMGFDKQEIARAEAKANGLANMRAQLEKELQAAPTHHHKETR